MSEQPIDLNAKQSPSRPDAPVTAKAKRAVKLQDEADNCVALSLRSDVGFAADLIDEAVMLARRARELSQR